MKSINLKNRSIRSFFKKFTDQLGKKIPTLKEHVTLGRRMISRPVTFGRKFEGWPMNQGLRAVGTKSWRN